MLFFVHRISKVMEQFTGNKPSAGQRVPVPPRTPMFIPLFEALACIGIVRDDDICKTWIPTIPLPEEGGIYSRPKEFETSVLYEWKASWIRANLERQTRISEQGIHFKPSMQDLAYQPAPAEEPANDENVYTWINGAFMKNGAPEEFDATNNTHIASLSKLSSSYKDPEVDNAQVVDPNVGNFSTQRLGHNYGCDNELFESYLKGMELLRSEGVMISIDLPHRMEGHYGWVLALKKEGEFFHCPVPTSKVPPFACFFGMIFQFGVFRGQDIGWFDVPGIMIRSPSQLMRSWINSFISKPKPP